MRYDLETAKFGNLTIAWPIGFNRERRVKWLCVCDCGNLTMVTQNHLLCGTTKSCGCLRSKPTVFVHGATGTAEYKAYCSAKSRCNNPGNPNFYSYGGRGIQFKFSSFSEFLEELGSRPKGKSVDRINNDGHYEHGNVKWSTPKEQAMNRRTTRGTA